MGPPGMRLKDDKVEIMEHWHTFKDNINALKDKKLRRSDFPYNEHHTKENIL